MQVIVERDAESNDRQTENTQKFVNDLKTKFMQQNVQWFKLNLDG